MPHWIDLDRGRRSCSEIGGSCWSWGGSFELKTTWCSSTPCYYRCVEGCFSVWAWHDLGFAKGIMVWSLTRLFSSDCTSSGILLVTLAYEYDSSNSRFANIFWFDIASLQNEAVSHVKFLKLKSREAKLAKIGRQQLKNRAMLKLGGQTQRYQEIQGRKQFGQKSNPQS